MNEHTTLDVSDLTPENLENLVSGDPFDNQWPDGEIRRDRAEYASRAHDWMRSLIRVN